MKSLPNMNGGELLLSFIQIATVSAAITFNAPQPCDWVDIRSADIPEDTEILNLAGCTDIKPQVGALAHLYQLKKIVIRNTKMSEFPNITEAGSTLRDITMDHNNISVINPLYFIGLDKLEIVNLGRNPYLDHLPDVPQFNTVREFYLQQSAYKKLVQLSHASNTKKLAFDNNVDVAHVDKQELSFYSVLQILGLDGNQIQVFPDAALVKNELIEIRVRNCLQLHSAPVLHMVALRTIGRLDIRDTPRLKMLPTLCHENLGSLTIKVSGSGLKLCDCRNAWLKQAAEAGANIEAVDSSTTCGGLKWHDISTTQLLSVCTDGKYIYTNPI